MRDVPAFEPAMRKIVIVIALSLAGCAGSDNQTRGLLEQVPIGAIDLSGDYQQLATCAYRKFTDGTASVMQKNDFPDIKQTRLAMMVGGLKEWELVFTQSSARQTHVELSSVQTIWGPDKLSTKSVIADVRGCSI